MAPTTGAGTKPVILCVEDEPHLCGDIVDELIASGYDAVGAADGRDALGVLETLSPDLILCDISMPRLGGYELLDILRSKRPDLADVPFVFLTAFSQREEIISGKRAGADDYLVKPVDFDLMLASIESRLGQVQRITAKAHGEIAELQGVLPDFTAGDKSGLLQVLDILAFGVVLIGCNGVAFANRAARAVHEAGDGLVIDTTIHTGSSHLAGELRTLVGDACAAGETGADHLASLSVPRPSGRRDLLLIACGLPDAGTAEARAVVFISDPERRPAVPGAVLADLFELTPTETEVARALAVGRRTDQIAADLGVSQTTVAFHMRNLFQKTGTHRQADLIALVLTGLATIAPEGA